MKMIFCYNQKTIKKDKDDWITSLKSEIETNLKILTTFRNQIPHLRYYTKAFKLIIQPWNQSTKDFLRT